MSFLKKLKKTLWDSFFGQPERSGTAKSSKKKKSKKTNKNSLKKIKSRVKIKAQKIKKVLAIKPPRKSKVVKKKATRPKPPQGKLRPVAAAPAPSLKNQKAAQKSQESQGTLVGSVTHFFSQAKVAAIKIEAQKLTVGDEIYIKGVTTRFKTKIDSMQINRVPVTQAQKGAEIGILVKKRVREGDQVFKL